MPRVNLAVAGASDAADRTVREVLSLNPADIQFIPETDVRLGAAAKNESELIDALAASLKAIGQAQPVLVRRSQQGEGFTVVAGRRRVQAALKAGLEVNAIVTDCDDETARRLAFEENYRRKQMSPIEFALNIAAYRVRAQPHNVASSELAKYFQVSPAQITQMEKLLKLPDDVQTQVHEGTLAVDAAFTLAKVDPAAREDVMKIAAEKARQEPKKGKLERVPPTAEQKAAFKSVAQAAKHDREEKAAPAKVQAKHVVAAARETETLTGRKIRNRNEIIAGLEALSVPGVPEAMNKFIDFFVGSYATGDAANDTGLRNRWNEIGYLCEAGLGKRGKRSEAATAVVVAKTVAKTVAKVVVKAKKTAKPKPVAKSKKKK